MRETDNNDLRLALQGVSRQTAEHIFANMSENAGRMLIEEMDRVDTAPYVDVINSRGKLLETLYDLYLAGEVVPDLEKCPNFKKFLEMKE